MIEFNDVFDAKKDLYPFVLSQRSSSASKVLEHVKIKLLGQEKDGTILYAWNDVSSYENSSIVTYFGIVDPSSSKNKVVFVHEKTVNPVCASINEEKSFLCFTTLEVLDTPEEESRERNSKDLFRLFLAEIQPQNRVFSLNIDRHKYLKGQFIYTNQFTHSDKNVKESHLVVQLHKESIGLYHVPFARVGNDVIMSGQPRTKQIQGKFVWSQWDMTSQRLYFIHFRKKKSQDPVYSPVLSCIQFESGTTHTVLFEVSLVGVPIPRSSSKTSVNYMEDGLWRCIPDLSFNLDVLSQPNGTMCICFQHPVQDTGKRASTGQPHSPQADVEYCTLEYTICMVHHAQILTIKVPNIRRGILQNTQMFFTFTNDYLLACLPGVFCHLLNVNIELEPSHHLLHHDTTFLYDSSPKYYTQITKGSIVYALEVNSNIAYKLSINHDTLLDLFMDTSTKYTRQAVIHYAVVYAKELPLLKKIMESMCNDPGSPEICCLMKELLLGSTYNLARKRLDRRLAKLLPFTTSSALSGHCEKNNQGTRLAVLSYSAFKGGINITDRKDDRKSQPHDDLFDNLLCHIKQTQINAYPRFDPSGILKEFMMLEHDNWEVPLNEKRRTSQKPVRKPSFFDSLSKPFKHNREPETSPPVYSNILSRMDIILGRKPPFFSLNSEHSKNKNFLLSQSRLKSHVVNCLMKDAQVKIDGICIEYTECQMTQSKMVCHLIWSILGPSGDDDFEDNLNIPARRRDYFLFQMFEAFLLAVKEVSFPLPPGFLQYFTKLAFRCLDFRLFLQYIDQGAIILDRLIVEHVIEDLGNQEETAPMLTQLISRLPSKEARKCLDIWKHPSATRNLAQKIVSHCLKEKDLPQMEPSDISAMSSVCIGSVDISSQCSFPPMATLLELLESKDPQVRKQPASRIDRHFLESNALLELHSKCGSDLSSVNF